MNIIYSWAAHEDVEPHVEQDIEEWRSAGYQITSINHRKLLGNKMALTPDELHKRHVSGDPALMDLYARVRALAATHDVLIVDNENAYDPEFLESLDSVYKVLVSGDDPESSDVRSKPFVRYFDHSFCWGINFDANSRVVDRFREWGAPRADWWPYGVRMDTYDPFLTETDIETKERDIDLVFVGSPMMKIPRLTELKAAFPQLEIYGRGWSRRGVIAGHRSEYGQWSWKGMIGGLRAVMLGLGDVNVLPMEESVSIFQRAKIGINIHLSYGPCNTRTFLLPSNGVMQICDNKEGLQSIYDVGSEVVGFDQMPDAIEKIRYYLDHPEERKKIAAAGYRRTIRDYQRLTTIGEAMNKIRNGMQESVVSVLVGS